MLLYYEGVKIIKVSLRGRVKFPTGGKVRDSKMILDIIKD